MKRLWLFGGLAGLLLGSAAPPSPAREPKPVPIEPAATSAATPFDPDPDAAADAVPAPAPTDAPAPPAVKRQARVAQREGGHGQVQVPDRAAGRRGQVDVPARNASDVRIVISLPQQKAWVFRDGVLLATSPVSTGRRGHETPAGTFRILEKKVRHRSNRYANAPMPYMQRLTWYGIALHAGRLPGYPASHGCIRLPRGFAKKLYRMTDFSTEVTVTHKRPKSAAAALAVA